MRLRSINGTVWGVFFFGVVLLSAGLIMAPHRVSAGSCGPYGVGYFTGKDYSCDIYVRGYIADQVSPGTFSTADTNKARFISDAQHSSASAFYISLMTGQRQSHPSASLINQWKNDINNQDIGIRVAYVSNSENSLLWPNGLGGLPRDYVFFREGSPTSVQSLVFYNKRSGRIYTEIKINCGNPLNSLALPNFDHPPIGSISLSCNSNGTGRITIKFSDPDGNTSAQLVVNYAGRTPPDGFFNYGSSGTYARTIPAAYVAGNWGAALKVRDSGGNQNRTYSATKGRCSQPPSGTVSANGCDSVKVSVGDSTQPSSKVQYYLKINGGPMRGPWTVPPSIRSVGSYAEFDYWKNNTVELYAKDPVTGAMTSSLGGTTLSACAQVTCQNTDIQFADTPAAGQAASFYVWVAVSSSTPSGPPSGPAGASFAITVTGPGSPSLTTSPYTPVPSSNPTTLKSNTESFTPTGGSYNIHWTFNGGESNSVTCQDNGVKVGYVPYFTVSSGDIAAGPGFGPGCTSSTAADITARNRGAAYNYFGAASQLGALATGKLDQFATDTTNNAPANLGGRTDGLPVNRPSELAFANSGVGDPIYGGNFGRENWCVPNYVTDALQNVTPGAPDYTLQGSHVYKLAPDSKLGNITLSKGVHVTLVVKGDVYLDGANDAVQYASRSSWNKLADIPQFSLIVQGNIYISKNITTLRGLYVAEPNGSSGGAIYTCATGIGPPPSVTDPNNDYSQCNKQLTVYGAVSAKKLVLGRTAGNLVRTSSVSDDPAEQFVYSPELWLGDLSGAGYDCTADPQKSACTYSSYTSLPPVL